MAHTTGEIVTALIDAGLVVDSFTSIRSPVSSSSREWLNATMASSNFPMRRFPLRSHWEHTSPGRSDDAIEDGNCLDAVQRKRFSTRQSFDRSHGTQCAQPANR